MKTVRLIVNPTASRVASKVRTAVRRALAGHQVTEVETTGRGHAIELAAEAAGDGVDVIVVLGGDGTVNEAANGLLGSGTTPTVLAALPGGSTNVFTRTARLPRRVAAAAEVVASAIERGSVRRLPVGRVNGRAFLFHVGIDYDAAVVELVERHNSLKRSIGQAIFVYAAFATWFRHYDHSRPEFRIEGDDGTGVDGSFAICMNTNPYTFFGPRPLNVVPGCTGSGASARSPFAS
ncbi:MAG: diacylglycerol/lipid kinase family protein [Acidimicrobiales bacterium]